MVTKLINRQQDAKIHTSIIAQNLHYSDNQHHDKHHHPFLPTFALSHATYGDVEG